MNFQNLAIVLFLALPVAVPQAIAQSFSYDGNRWYEIEVSIFTNSSSASNKELVIPDKTDISYPEPIRRLIPASSSFMVNFDELAAGPALEEILPEAETETDAAVIGPINETTEDSFRILNFNRDPFIALGEEAAKFSGYNSDINRSGEHRLLYHAVWRQPVLNRSQTTAIFVSGGNQYGSHSELEGSLRFSYNVNRVDVEAKLWFLEFGVPFPGREFKWRVPERPFQGNDFEGVRSPGSAMLFGIEDLSYMNQVRAMISNELHYLDHPALGMLVEIRPYQLPEPTEFAFE